MKCESCGEDEVDVSGCKYCGHEQSEQPPNEYVADDGQFGVGA